MSFKCLTFIKKIKKSRDETCLRKYGITDVGLFRVRILYKNISFDSYPELAFYIYCEDHDIIVERNPKINLEYFDEDMQKLRKYHPDFKINESFIEIKSHYWWGRETPSYQSFINSVSKILFEENYHKYIDYVKEKYGSNYMKQFKVYGKNKT